MQSCNEAGLAHTRYLLHAFFNRTKVATLRQRFGPKTTGFHSQRQDVNGGDSHRYSLKTNECAEKHSGASEKHERESNLSDDEAMCDDCRLPRPRGTTASSV